MELKERIKRRINEIDGLKFKEDLERIQIALKNELDITASLTEVDSLWEEVSDYYCAGFMGVPDDDKAIINMIKLVL